MLRPTMTNRTAKSRRPATSSLRLMSPPGASATPTVAQSCAPRCACRRGSFVPRGSRPVSAACPRTDTDAPRRRDIMSRISGCDLLARASCPSGELGCHPNAQSPRVGGPAWREVRGAHGGERCFRRGVSCCGTLSDGAWSTRGVGVRAVRRWSGKRYHVGSAAIGPAAIRRSAIRLAWRRARGRCA